MPSKYPIADMHKFPLGRKAGRLVLLREADHLLRRFGQLEILDLAPGERTDFTLRSEADRFLFPADGSVTATLLDLRETSPSKNARAEFALSASDPHGLLVPFGVACSLSATEAARLIVLSTHSASHPDDRSITADEIARLPAAQ